MSVGVLGVLSIVSGAQVCLTQYRIGAATCSCGSGLKASSMQSIKWTPHWRLLLLDLLLNSIINCTAWPYRNDAIQSQKHMFV